MAKKKKNTKKLKEKLTFKYRLVVLNEDTFEERFSFKLNRLNVFVFASLFSIFLVGITIILIAFTPLREYIPGYSSSALKKKASDLVYKVDSLQQQLAINDVYIQNIQQVLTGKIKDININKDSIIEQLRKEDVDLSISPVDSTFREEVEREERYSVFEKATKKTDLVFFAPISGEITDT
ncbi:MAG TPA: M23 family peptidase, partial [Flavobacteriia bacterium]|nr:M23 family peptidase [Flavobacteriia bacterium]